MSSRGHAIALTKKKAYNLHDWKMNLKKRLKLDSFPFHILKRRQMVNLQYGHRWKKKNINRYARVAKGLDLPKEYRSGVTHRGRYVNTPPEDHCMIDVFFIFHRWYKICMFGLWCCLKHFWYVKAFRIHLWGYPSSGLYHQTCAAAFK